MSEMIVFLDNVRSTHNVGSIFRTADGAGVERVLLGGYTPTPIDRFGREQAAIKKTSLGATANVLWEKVEVSEYIDRVSDLKHSGYRVVAVEQTSQSILLSTFTPPEKVVYIFGNEIDGVSSELLALADTTVEIPMAGKKESLNVSVTAGIVLFHW